MGAYVTAALVSAHPGEFRMASHTGGGVRPSRSPTMLQRVHDWYAAHGMS